MMMRIAQVYNVAVGDRTSLNELFESIKSGLSGQYPYLSEFMPVYRDFCTGDVRHSLADILKAEELLGYKSTHNISEGVEVALDWYTDNFPQNKKIPYKWVLFCMPVKCL